MLGDFGSARFAQEAQCADRIEGTAEYLSPEVNKFEIPVGTLVRDSSMIFMYAGYYANGCARSRVRYVRSVQCSARWVIQLLTAFNSRRQVELRMPCV